MSDSDDPSAAIVHAVASVVPQSRISIAAAVLLAYEYVLTFDQEVSLFWFRRKTGATWLFLLIRYMAILSLCLLNTATYAHMSDESCLWLNKVQAPIQIAEYLPWAVFSGMRALAVTGLNWTFGGIVFAFAVVPFAANVWIMSLGVTGSNFPVVGCGGGSNSTRQDTLIAVPLSRSCAIVADILIIIATWRYAIKGGLFRRELRAVTASTLANVLLYNGTIYFLLTAILIGRYLIALQAANQKTLGSDDASLPPSIVADHGGRVETLRFASRVVGSLGATLEVEDGIFGWERETYCAADEEDSHGTCAEEPTTTHGEDNHGESALRVPPSTSYSAGTSTAVASGMHTTDETV
ncbi:hypothetical protein C8Q77DRAFT_1230977 [Trametes polyzona]|nr:hypothetical protein C8Q77DRAFT_1230977 [Trametes polyzona]